MAIGESILEIAPGRTSTFPLIHRHTVTLSTPTQLVTGQLMAAETIEPASGRPIFRPRANETITIEAIEEENHQDIPTSVTVTTDAEGRFSAQLLPGLYGILLPNMSDYFGDEVIVHYGEAARDRDANKTKTYEWPLVEPFPDLAGVNEFNVRDDRYFASEGMPIHGGREQFLELRVRKELYHLEVFGTESTQLNQKIIVIDDDNNTYTTAYSPTLVNDTQLTLSGTAGNFNTPVFERLPQIFRTEPIMARWHDLPPGDYSSSSRTVPAHTLAAPFFGGKKFLDWPVPGRAPTLAQAAFFDVNNLPNNEFLPEPLVRSQAGGFEVTFDSYTPDTYQVFQWVPSENAYADLGMRSGGNPVETTFDAGFFQGPVDLGGPVTAVWTTGGDNTESYPVRVTAGDVIYIGGDMATTRDTLPRISYSLELTGEAAEDPALAIDGAHYLFGDDNLPIQTGGTPLSGLQQALHLTKTGGDNFVEQYQSQVRVLGNGQNPQLAVTVGLAQGMEIKATLQDVTPVPVNDNPPNPLNIPAAGVIVEVLNRYGRVMQTLTTNSTGEVTFQGLPGYADYFLRIEGEGYTPIRRRLNASDATPGMNPSTAAKHDIAQDIRALAQPTLHEPSIPHNR